MKNLDFYHKPRIVKVLKVKVESPTVKTIFFKDKLASKAKPGQFLMVWIPGVDEVPMSLSYIGGGGDISAITVKMVGEATKALHKLKNGDILGIRGPYGNGFNLVKGDVLLIGGGVGVAPLLPLIKQLKNFGSKPVLIVGAKSKDELILIREAKKILGLKNVLTATEDGSEGFKGLASNLLEEILREGKLFNQIYASGPELMLKKVLNLALKFKVEAQLSLTRYIKCGVGLCGSCAINGLRVCTDGPIFSSKILAKIKEFGVYNRDASGRRIKIE